MALTSNDEVNLLAAIRGAELFGRKQTYRLSAATVAHQKYAPSNEVLAGRVLFANDVTYAELDRTFAAGDVIKSTKLTKEFDFNDFEEQYPNALPMFLLDASGKLLIRSTNSELTPIAGQTVVVLVAAKSKQPLSI